MQNYGSCNFKIEPQNKTQVIYFEDLRIANKIPNHTMLKN
jgi:hypothetical protein